MMTDMTNETTTTTVSTRTKIILAIAGLLIGAAAGLFVFKDSLSVKRTDDIVKEGHENMDNFESEVKQSEAQIIRETTIIREKVAAEARDLPPDDLVGGVLYELEDFRRGTSGDSASQSAAGMGR
jgi:hypothetical protein